MNINTYVILIKGQVQGVGFRPFIHNLAIANSLVGSVSNNGNGVVIYINTTLQIAQGFLNKVVKEKPGIAIITDTQLEVVPFMTFTEFHIVPSDSSCQINIPLTPDFAVCPRCKYEIKENRNRRYYYGFTTCVHCGPRFSITKKYPFERENTSLSNLPMCATCMAEYEDPSDRRFHSQTNTCSHCGITLRLTNNNGVEVNVAQSDLLRNVANHLADGKIVAIKNTNGYMLCCDATNRKVIQRLRNRKERPTKPFAVLYPTIEAVNKRFDLSDMEEKALQSGVAPIVIIHNRIADEITDIIAPGLNQLGVMLPSSSLMELLMMEVRIPIIATSGNIHGMPIISDEIVAHKELLHVADYFVHHDLDIRFPQDDSVMKFVSDQRIIIRRSRGLAPNMIGVTTEETEPILAMGAHLKSTFTYVPHRHPYVSQYFGNLDSFEVSRRNQDTIQRFMDLFNVTPLKVLVDAHSQYQSSILGVDLAINWHAEVIEVQHHKAHFTSVLGEQNLFGGDDRILGVVWDGTGLGEDGQIWGGEFFIFENDQIKRHSHFEYYDWLANDKMSKEPRLALLCLMKADNVALVRSKFTDAEWNIHAKRIKINRLKTSSVGRIFDAVASALDVLDFNTYEAEASMKLENLALSSSIGTPTDYLAGIEYIHVPSQVLVRQVVNDVRRKEKKEDIAYNFIFTLSKVIMKMAQAGNFKIIACSGGVFQNALLVSILSEMMKNEGLDLRLNIDLSPNDENISFGQWMYYKNIKN